MAKLIYNDQLKFGVEISNNGQTSVCLFQNERSKRTLESKQVVEVDSKLVSGIKEIVEKDQYDYSAIYRGEEYYRKRRVLNMSCLNGNIILASVKGSKYYNVRIKKDKDGINSSCSCPVGKECKHIYATYLAVNSVSKLLDAYNERAEIGEDFVTDLDNVARLGFNNLKSLDNVIYKFETENVNFIKKCINYFGDHHYIANNVKLMLQICAYNTTIRQKFENLLKIEPKLHYQNELLHYCEKGLYLASEDAYFNNDDAIFYYFANHKYKSIFTFFIERRYLQNYSLIEYVLERIDIDDNVFNLYKNTIGNSDSWYSYDIEFFKKLTLKQKEELLLLPDYNVCLKYNDIKDVDKDIRRTHIVKMDIDMEDDFIRIIETEYKVDKNLDYVGILILKYKDNFGYYYPPAHIKKFIDKINNMYFSDYLNYEVDGYLRRYRTSFKYRKGVNSIDSNKLERFFNYSYKIEKYHDATGTPKTEICYQLIDKYGGVALGVTKKDDLCHYDEKNIDDYNDELPCFVIDKIEEIYHDEIRSAIDEIEEEIRKEKEEKKLKEALSYMAKVNVESNSLLSLSASRKASLQYFLKIDKTVDNDTRYSLSLKVGIDKYYVVKNFVEFLSKFYRREKYSYGKDLVLVHDLDNFNEFDSQVLKTFMSSNMPRDYYNNQGALLNEPLLSYLLQNLKGRNIFIDKEAYLVSLEEKEYKAAIDKDYNFKLDNYDSNLRYLDVFDRIYLIDDKNKRIDILKCEKADLPFYKFALEYNNICLKQINKQFKENIYANYFNNIEISPEIKEDFKLNNLQIDSYFDYVDKQITIKTEYLLGETKTTKKKIKNKLDLARLENYEILIKSLGFEDDRLVDDQDVLSFFNMDFASIRRYGNVYLSQSIQNKQLAKFYPGKIVVKQNSTVMEAFLTGSEYSDEELYEIIKSIRHKKKYVLLSDDRIVDISDKTSEEFEKAIEDLGLNGKKLSEPKPLPIINSLKALSHEKYCEVDEYLTNMISDISGYKNSNYKAPKLNAELRVYQEEGYKWLKVLSNYGVGGILADDMGLGKTIQIIALITSDDTKEPSLIVCPKSLVFNWKNEFSRFSPDTKVIELYGLKDEREKTILKISGKEKAVYITSYESLLRDIESYKSKFNYLIIDEAQSIKNVNAQKTKTIKKIEAKHKFALTGTPIENNIVDLYSIFDFVLPGYFMDVNEFKNNNDNDDFIRKVSKAIGPFVLRRTKENVLKELPEKFERLLTCEMNSKQRKVYDAHKKQAQELIEREGKTFDILPYLMKLRQICIDPSILIENYEGSSAKIETLMELIKDYISNGHKILLFSSFVKALDVVSNKLNKEGISYFTITGDTSAKRRLEIANAFNNDSKEKIALISLKAGGTGLNLIGADTVIHLDPWWNVAAENQASDRSHRIGQTKNVEVIKLVCENSIEQRVIELQNIKKDLVDKVISNTDKTVTSSSLEDIKFILE